MKKIAVVILALMIVSAIGCKQQPQQQKGGSYPGGVMMRSPDEIRQLEQIARQAPNNAEAWIQLGNALMDSSRFAEAVEAYQKALALDPKNLNVRVDMGTCYRGSGRPQQAIEEYRKALAINPNHINANRNMAVVLTFDLNDKKAGAKAFERYLELAPNAPDAAEIRKLVEDLKAGN